MSKVLKAASIKIEAKQKYAINYDSSIYVSNSKILLNKDRGNITCNQLEIDTDILDKANAEAEEIINKANAEATRIIELAKGEKYEIQEEAQEIGYNKGFMEGKKEGLISGEKKYKEKIQSIQKLVDMINSKKQEIYSSTEKDMANLAVYIASKILHKELSSNDGAILNIVNYVLKQVDQQTDLVLKLSPYDYKFFSNNRDLLEIPELTIISDESLNKGDCIIDTSNGIINAGIEKQYETIKNKLALVR